MDTRTRLLDEGERLMKSSGYSGFSYADIARTVEIRKASIHYHFPSKVDLAIATVGRYHSVTSDALGAVDAASDAAAHVRALGALFVAGYEGAGHGCLCASLVADWGSLPEPVQAEVHRYWRLCIDWLITALEPRSDAGEQAEIIFSLLEGGMLTARVHRSVGPLSRAIECAVRMLG